MWLSAEKILEIIPQLEESDKAISGATARDPIMQGQTNIFFGLGMSRDPAIVDAGWTLFHKTLAEFKAQMVDLISRYQGGGLGIDRAIAEWKAITGANYKTMFKAGAMAVGNPYYDKIGLPDKDLAFMSKARRFESSFFKKFLMDIDNPNHVAVHPYLQRAEYYAESGKAQFFNGMVNGAGDDLEVHWVLSEVPEEHCEDCPVLASRVWTWRTLPTVPRAGDTACMFRCYCHLEFQPAPSTSARSYAGSATPQALSAEGRWGSVTDKQGNPIGGALAAEIDDMFGAMFKARQMISLTDGPEKAEWIGIRRQINKGIIDRAGQDYRALPNVSVSQLEIAAKAASGMGAGLVSDIGGLRAGAEAVFLRGNFYTAGIISELNGAKYLTDIKGNRHALNDETDIVFTAKERLNPIDPRDRNVAKLLKKSVFGTEQLYDEFLVYYDAAKAANSTIPYQRAWVVFRQHWQETGVGWVLKRTNEQIEALVSELFEGGAGSGNFDHAGRPGEVGGSAPEGEVNADPSSADQNYLPAAAEVDVGIGTRLVAQKESVKEYLVGCYTMASGNSTAWQDMAGRTYGIDAAQQALALAGTDDIERIAHNMLWDAEMKSTAPGSLRMWGDVPEDERNTYMAKAREAVLKEIRERLSFRFNSDLVNPQAIEKQILALRDEANAVAVDGAELHRGMAISRELADEIDSAIRTKGSYELKVNPVSSYTESSKLAERFAVKGEGGHRPKEQYRTRYAPVVYSVKGNKTDTWIHYKQPSFLKVSAVSTFKFNVGGRTQKEVVMGHPKGTVTLTAANYRRLGWD